MQTPVCLMNRNFKHLAIKSVGVNLLMISSMRPGTTCLHGAAIAIRKDTPKLNVLNPDTDDDPDDLDYQEDGGEDMSITSEGTSDDRIVNDELNQLQKDLGKPALQTRNTDHVLEFNDLADTSSSTTNKDLTTFLWMTDDFNSEQRSSSPEGRTRSSTKSQQ
ncbi:unnamed protein product [Rhizopus stolonifer]